MSKIALPRQLLSDAGLVPVYAPASAEGNRIENNGRIIGPFDPVTYNQRNGGTGQVHVDYSETENVTIAALLIP